jgi:hypothetical protein
MGWGVFAPTAALPHGALRGRYVGASGDVSLGLGAGGKLLVGGSHKTISLQPLGPPSLPVEAHPLGCRSLANGSNAHGHQLSEDRYLG